MRHAHEWLHRTDFPIFLPRLNEILAGVLAGSDSAGGRAALSSTDSPADMAIKLMDRLIVGEEVRG